MRSLKHLLPRILSSLFLFFFFSSVQSIYEDEIGVSDWLIQPLGVPSRALLSPNGRVLYLGSDVGGTLAAVPAKNGPGEWDLTSPSHKGIKNPNFLWRQVLPEAEGENFSFHSLLPQRTSIYTVTSADETVYVRKWLAHSGLLVWEHPLRATAGWSIAESTSTLQSVEVAHDQSVIVISAENEALGLHPDNGKELWRVSTQDTHDETTQDTLTKIDGVLAHDEVVHLYYRTQNDVKIESRDIWTGAILHTCIATSISDLDEPKKIVAKPTLVNAMNSLVPMIVYLYSETTNAALPIGIASQAVSSWYNTPGDEESASSPLKCPFAGKITSAAGGDSGPRAISSLPLSQFVPGAQGRPNKKASRPRMRSKIIARKHKKNKKSKKTIGAPSSEDSAYPKAYLSFVGPTIVSSGKQDPNLTALGLLYVDINKDFQVSSRVVTMSEKALHSGTRLSVSSPNADSQSLTMTVTELVRDKTTVQMESPIASSPQSNVFQKGSVCPFAPKLSVRVHTLTVDGNSPSSAQSLGTDSSLNLPANTLHTVVGCHQAGTNGFQDVDLLGPIFTFGRKPNRQSSELLLTFASDTVAFASLGAKEEGEPAGEFLWISPLQGMAKIVKGSLQSIDMDHSKDDSIDINGTALSSSPETTRLHFTERWQDQIDHISQLVPLKLTAIVKNILPDEFASVLFERESSVGSPTSMHHAFGARKILVVLTTSGVVLGIDTYSGKALWSVLVAPLIRHNVHGLGLSKVRLLQTEGSEVAVTGLYQDTQPYVLWLDAFTGREKGTFFVSKNNNKKLVSPLSPNAIVVRGAQGVKSSKLVFTHLPSTQALKDVADVHEIPFVSVGLTFEDTHVQFSSSRPLSSSLSSRTSDESASRTSDESALRVHMIDEKSLLGYEIKAKQQSQEHHTANLAHSWSLRFGANERLVANAETRHDRLLVYARTRILGDDSLLVKHVDPNLIIAVTETTPTVNTDPFITIYLISASNGKILHRMIHENAGGPVHVMKDENFIIYSFFNVRAKRSELGCLSLYKDSVGTWDLNPFKHDHLQKSLQSRDDVMVLQRSYVFPQRIRTLEPTQTQRGITTKHVLVGFGSGKILLLHRRWLDPRRPTKKPGPKEQKEGLMQYNPMLPILAPLVVTFNRTIARLSEIRSLPIQLESTTLVVGVGLDLFFRPIKPSRGYDSLETFNHLYLAVFGIILFVGVLWAKDALAKKKAQDLWK